MTKSRLQKHRRASVYLAVLGTALIVSVLAMSSLALQRVQNRMLTASSNVRQAQLNAEAAIQLGLLAIQNDPDWRTTYANGDWFADRNLGQGGCSLNVVDPADGNLADDAAEPILMTGVGTSGKAVQRVTRTVDAFNQPLECLRSSVAAGDAIGLNGAVLRATDSGLISAESTSAAGSTIYGQVEARTIGGSTYSGATTQVAAADRPDMPDWNSVFDYYRTNGTEILITALPQMTKNLGRNTSFDSGTSYWNEISSDIDQVNNPFYSVPYSLRVKDRSSWTSGAAQSIDQFVKPGQQYLVEVRIYSAVLFYYYRNYRISLTTKGTLSSETTVNSPNFSVAGSLMTNLWTKVSATLTAPSWSGDLEYAYVKISGADAGNTVDFYLDDFLIREVSTGRLINRVAIGPGLNPYASTLNAQGLYWIDCGGNNLIIERARIKGSLLVINPGSGSMIGPGPISWTPATPGYPRCW